MIMKTLSRVLTALLFVAWVAVPDATQSVWAAQKTHVKGYTKKDGTHVAPHERKAPQPKSGNQKTSGASSTAAHDTRGRIARSETAKHAFEVQTGYPNGRPGYVIDHIVPLACGGADQPSNMQWQTVADAKAKDRVERKGCGH